jgi:hypothetical protein
MSPPKKPIDSIAPISIERIAFGVRYEPKYSVMDHIGAVIDSVLRDESTPFGPQTFPFCQHTPAEKVLLNPNNQDYLKLNERDTILQMSIFTRNLSRVEELAFQFENYVLKPLKEHGKLTNIMRYGILCSFSECATALGTLPTEHYLAGDFETSRSLSLHFTRRLPVLEAVAMKHLRDYRNIIYTIEQDEDSHVNISIDYQEYFDPTLTSSAWAKKPFDAFADRALQYLDGEFAKWFDKLAKKIEVA